jgi:dTDP-4-amino-4,6-dideoxygalactose transaminase
MASEFIPFNRPYVTGKEQACIEQALKSHHL